MKFAGLTAEYRKKPVVVRAVRIAQSMVINTPGGTMQGSPGDWLITGIRDEQYFCKDDIFREAYEPVNGGWLDMLTVFPELVSVAEAGFVERRVVAVSQVASDSLGSPSELVRVRMDCGHAYVVGYWAAPSEGRVARCVQCFREHQRARCACEGCDPDW
jgi:hypothetical protein